jgi:hypothetical protein
VGALPGVKRPRRKDGLSPQSRAAVKNEYKCTFTPPTWLRVMQRDNLSGLPPTSKQGPSSQIPSKYYLPYGKNTISHDGRAPIIVRVRSLVVFLSPFRQLPGSEPQLHRDSFPSNPIQFFVHQPTHHPAKCYVLITLS